ncbi:MAG: hypothetical protein AAB606_00225 [Patescibacteria group bacterium]
METTRLPIRNSMTGKTGERVALTMYFVERLQYKEYRLKRQSGVEK